MPPRYNYDKTITPDNLSWDNFFWVTYPHKYLARTILTWTILARKILTPKILVPTILPQTIITWTMGDWGSLCPETKVNWWKEDSNGSLFFIKNSSFFISCLKDLPKHWPSGRVPTLLKYWSSIHFSGLRWPF